MRQFLTPKLNLRALSAPWVNLWVNASLRKKGLTIFAIPLVGMLAGLLVLFPAWRREAQLDAQVEHTIEVRSVVRSLLEGMTRAQASVYGSMLSNGEAHLEPFYRLQDELPEAIERLTQLQQGNQAQLERVELARRLIEEKFSVLTELVELGSNTAAVDAAGGVGGNAQVREGIVLTAEVNMVVLQEQLEEMRVEEERRLAAGITARNRAQGWARMVVVTAFGLALTGGGLAVILFTGGLLRRAELLSGNALRLPKLEPLRPIPVRHDELGDIDKALRTTQGLLQEQREQLQLTLSGARVALWEMPDTDTRQLSYTGDWAVLRAMGIDPEQPPQDTSEREAIIHPEDRRAYRDFLEALVHRSEHGDIRHLEYRVNALDGDEHTLQVTGRVHGNHEGQRLLGVLIDVSEARQAARELAEREALLRGVMAASPDLISVLDAEDGRLRLASSALGSMLGYSREELEQNPLEFSHPQDKGAAEEAIASVLQRETSHFQVRQRYRHADGHWLTIESSGRALVDEHGALSGVVIVTRDISQQVELERYQQEAKDAAEAANRAKSQFLSRMSHELRTPLNAVLGFAQMLELSDLDDEDQDSVGHIRKAGEHLLELINEILDLSRIEAGRMALSLEPVQIGEVVTEVLELIRPLANQAAITIDAQDATSCQDFVMADRQRLKQVLLNLLSNAVKYNRVEGRIILRASQVDADRYRLEVEDTGPGIPAEKLGQLFEPFNRLGAEHKNIEGSGLGLSLSKQLTEIMGGELEVSSSPGEGSCFRVVLTLTEGPLEQWERTTADVQRGAPLAVSPSGCRVLCIEDNLSNLRLIERLLAKWPDTRLMTAMQARLGLDLAAEHQPDVILLDLNLPDMHGHEALKALQANPATHDIPVIVISADATSGQIARLREAGAFAYLTKPLDIQQFWQVFADALEKRQAHTPA